jgi:hypothetical protein
MVVKLQRCDLFVNAILALHRTNCAMSEGNAVTEAATRKIVQAVDRVRKADAAATSARQALRTLMRAEIDARRTTKSEIARALGVSRQRVQQMLEP